ncbi:MAG: DUF2191 domain-containing protein [Nitriliruptorales bacterium]|nr:DUF2191 domain-containing protein [Nitriliruptorales bacterium]
MKTTLNLDPELLRRAKRRAAQAGTTLTSVVEEALRNLLRQSPGGEKYILDLPTVTGERPPSVDPADRGSLYEVMDDTS